MLKEKEKPTFVVHWFPGDGFTRAKLDDFVITGSTKYKTIIFMPYKDYQNYSKDNVTLVYSPISLTQKNSELAKKIKNFI